MARPTIGENISNSTRKEKYSDISSSIHGITEGSSNTIGGVPSGGFGGAIHNDDIGCSYMMKSSSLSYYQYTSADHYGSAEKVGGSRAEHTERSGNSSNGNIISDKQMHQQQQKQIRNSTTAQDGRIFSQQYVEGNDIITNLDGVLVS